MAMFCVELTFHSQWRDPQRCHGNGLCPAGTMACAYRCVLLAFMITALFCWCVSVYRYVCVQVCVKHAVMIMFGRAWVLYVWHLLVGIPFDPSSLGVTGCDARTHAHTHGVMWSKQSIENGSDDATHGSITKHYLLLLLPHYSNFRAHNRKECSHEFHFPPCCSVTLPL